MSHTGIAHDDGTLRSEIIRRHHLTTRLTHWSWAACLFFLLLSGLQIFNAHPVLNIGKESGFEYDNAILEIKSQDAEGAARGTTVLFGRPFDTTGFLGSSGTADDPVDAAFPSWLTIPSYRDLATGRVVHFFFAWAFVATLVLWAVASLYNRHLRQDLVPTRTDMAALPQDIYHHLTGRFHSGERYAPLQKLTYAGVLFVLFPAMVITGLCMSPGIDAVLPWLPELLGGRQTARSIHFGVMLLLILFFIVHIVMVFAAGPLNEMRSMVTGYYRVKRAGPKVHS